MLTRICLPSPRNDSYTRYDGLGRIIEVGEKGSPTADIRTVDMLDTTAVKNWLASGTNRQLAKTIYDEPVNLSLQSYSASRKRVTASIYLENPSDAEGDSTLYSYDISGNVKTQLQHIEGMGGKEGANNLKEGIYDVLTKLKEYAKSQGFENLRVTYKRVENSSSKTPIAENKVVVDCINRLVLRKVKYEYSFGPGAF